MDQVVEEARRDAPPLCHIPNGGHYKTLTNRETQVQVPAHRKVHPYLPSYLCP